MTFLGLPLIVSWAQVVLFALLIFGALIAYRVLRTVERILSESERLLDITKGWAREAATHTNDTKHVVIEKTNEVRKAVETVPERVVEAVFKPPGGTRRKPNPPGDT